MPDAADQDAWGPDWEHPGGMLCQRLPIVTGPGRDAVIRVSRG